MSEPPDLDALAKRYLDLWQDQLGAVSKDRETAEIMAQTMELMNAGATAFATMAAAQENPNKGNADDDANAAPTGTPGTNRGTDRGTAAAAAAPGASDSDLDELARRLERLEKRLDTLEAGAAKSRPRARKKPRKG